MMNRLHILAATAVLILAAGSARAQSVGPASQQFSFNGVAVPGCVMQPASSPSSNNASVTSSAPGAADIVIGQLVGDDAVSVGATVILTLPAACNQAHTISLGSINGGLINLDGTPTGGPFRDVLPYTVAINWGVGSQA